MTLVKVPSPQGPKSCLNPKKHARRTFVTGEDITMQGFFMDIPRYIYHSLEFLSNLSSTFFLTVSTNICLWISPPSHFLSPPTQPKFPSDHPLQFSTLRVRTVAAAATQENSTTLQRAHSHTPPRPEETFQQHYQYSILKSSKLDPQDSSPPVPY